MPAASNARTNAATVDACAPKFPGLASRRFTVGSETARINSLARPFAAFDVERAVMRSKEA